MSVLSADSAEAKTARLGSEIRDNDESKRSENSC
jgi:hypothetical protein